MNIQITGKQMDVGQAMQQHVTKRLTDICAKYFDTEKAIDANVIVHKQQGGAFTFVQITLVLGIRGGVVIKGEERATEPYAAFDLAAEHIAKQLRRYKTRLRDHHHPGVAASTAMILTARERVFAPEEDTETETPPATNADGYPLVIAENHQHVEAMSVRDAVMRMDLSGSAVYMFRNPRSNTLNVVYRRQDGNIGWIDPEEKAG
jgi:ribosomal subunit interface protein